MIDSVKLVQVVQVQVSHNIHVLTMCPCELQHRNAYALTGFLCEIHSGNKHVGIAATTVVLGHTWLRCGPVNA